MTAVGPGSLVRCIRDDWWERDGGSYPIVGHIYTVLEIFRSQKGAGYRLEEIGSRAFDTNAFTPIDDSAIDVFRTLAEPTKDRVTA